MIPGGATQCCNRYFVRQQSTSPGRRPLQAAKNKCITPFNARVHMQAQSDQCLRHMAPNACRRAIAPNGRCG